MTLLLLVRHALTDATGKRLSGTARGIHLSGEGREQAARLGQRLASVRLGAIYASPLERCVETADAIVAGRSLRTKLLPAVEEVGYGDWTGRPFGRLQRTALWRQLMQRPSAVRFPGGETLAEVQGRTVTALEEIAARHPNATVAVVTHADVIRLALAHYAGIHIDLFQRLIVSPVSVTALLLGDRIPRIVRVNDTGTTDDFVAAAGRNARRAPAPSRVTPASRGGRRTVKGRQTRARRMARGSGG